MEFITGCSGHLIHGGSRACKDVQILRIVNGRYCSACKSKPFHISTFFSCNLFKIKGNCLKQKRIFSLPVCLLGILMEIYILLILHTL